MAGRVVSDAKIHVRKLEPHGAGRVGMLMRAAVCLTAGLLFVGAAFWTVLSPGRPADAGLRIPPPFEVRIVHEGACADRPDAPTVCREAQHWHVRVGSREMDTPSDLDDALRAEASRWKRGARLSVVGDERAPWWLIQRIAEQRVSVKIENVEWVLLGPERRSAKVPSVEGPRDPNDVILEEIRVFMKWDPNRGSTIRKVGNRGEMGSDEELMAVVLGMVEDYGNAGRSDFPLLIDATPDVPWKDVDHLADLCRKANVRRIEIAAPFWRPRPAGK